MNNGTPPHVESIVAKHGCCVASLRTSLDVLRRPVAEGDHVCVLRGPAAVTATAFLISFFVVKFNFSLQVYVLCIYVRQKNKQSAIILLSSPVINELIN